MQQPPSVHAEGAATHATRVVETRESKTDPIYRKLCHAYLCVNTIDAPICGPNSGANGDAQTWIRNEQMK